MVNIIFLDFDGVLIHERHILAVYPNVKRDKFGQLFCPETAKLINDLIEKTGAKVVISSSWRADGLKGMQQLWSDRGMSGEVIGVTPHLYVRKSKHVNTPSMPRGVEIDAWLSINHYQHHKPCCVADRETSKKCKIKNYLIIDDDTDMLYNQRNNFIRCDAMDGFTQTDYEKALKILKV